MSVFLNFLIILGACALGLGFVVVLVAWAASRLDVAENAASGFQRHEPYTDQQAREANRWPVNDYDPTAPARLRPIPGQRKESS